jgi:spectinomycin phosphotransferase
MLEKPNIPDQAILDCLRDFYSLHPTSIRFLPLGADLNTAVYRVVCRDGAVYFCKLRGGEFHPALVAVPNYLYTQGLRKVIPAIETQSEALWADLPPYKVILYPFVDGQDGFERHLTDRQWIKFGAALRQFHTTRFPPAITRGLPVETFSPRWRDTVRDFLGRIQEQTYIEPVAAEMADFLRGKEQATQELVARSERLAGLLRQSNPEFILCHADIHAWNLLVVDADTFYMVDWDTQIFAPKERDLMFVGSGLGGGAHPPQEEEALFYRGYGPVQIDPVAIAYYRYERIVEDISVYCQQIFLSDEGGEDRPQALLELKSNYQPGGTIELAYQADKSSISW